MAPKRENQADTRDDDDLNGDSRDGGDAEAAGSVEERESVARDDDEPWGSDD